MGFYSSNNMVIFLNRTSKPSHFIVVDDQHYGYTRIFADLKSLTMEFVRNDGKPGDSVKLPDKTLVN